MNRPRSPRAPWLFGLILVAVLVAAWLLPWFVVATSSGSQSPPGGPTGADDASVKRTRTEVYPYDVKGDPAPKAEQVSQDLGLGLAIASAATGLAILISVVAGGTRWGRWTGLALSLTAAAAVATAVVITWRDAPAAFRDVGVRDAFTSQRLASGYLWSALFSGWVAAILAVPAAFALLGAIYLGSPPSVDELERRRSEQATRAGGGP